MGEENIWSELNQVKTDVQGIRADVTEIKDALLGDKYGNKGYATRICELEDHCNIVREEIDHQKTFRKVVRWTIATATALAGLLLSFFKVILPNLNK